MPAPNALPEQNGYFSTSAAKVTQSMMISGGNEVLFSLRLLLEYALLSSQNQIALNSWFALQTEAQMLNINLC